MFWSQVDDNSINDLLIREDVTLEEVLDHESILQECKIQNEKLIKFFCQSEIFSKLINYVLVTPNEEIEEKMRFKYPSLVCEVLTSDVPEINELLANGVTTDGLNDSGDTCTVTLFVDRVLNILETENIINPLTLSYLMKIMLNILKYNNDKVMSHLLRKECSLDMFLKHVENNGISVFFTEFLMCEDECTTTRVQWLKEGRLLFKCAQLFSLTDNKNNSVQALISEVINSSTKYFANKGMLEEIRNQINGKGFLDLIFNHLSNPKADSDIITGCIRVVRTIIDFKTDSDSHNIDAVKEMIISNFKTVVTLFSSPPKQMYDPMPTTIGSITPFGPTRIEIVYLIESLLKLKDLEINTMIGQTNIFMVLMSFVSQYKWNTLFHLGLLRIFDILFADLSPNSQFMCLLHHLVSDYDIYHWYITVVNQTSKISNPRSGSMGLLWKIGNHLDSLWCSQICDELINKEPNECDEWIKVVNEHLKHRNIKNIIIPPKIDSRYNDFDNKMVEFGDDDIMSTNQDTISEFCRNKSDNLDDMFGASASASNDDWFENELQMPSVPVDDFSTAADISKNPTEEEDDSSSDDEESPSVIKQKCQGRAAKYLIAEVPNHGELKLFDVPDMCDDAMSKMNFDDPWTNKNASESVRDNWAHFNS